MKRIVFLIGLVLSTSAFADFKVHGWYSCRNQPSAHLFYWVNCHMTGIYSVVDCSQAFAELEKDDCCGMGMKDTFHRVSCEQKL